GRPYTRTVGDLGDYRLVATRLPDGDVLVTGLPMQPVYENRYRLLAVEVGVGVAAMVLAALAGAVIVRATLRPLNRVAATARRVGPDVPPDVAHAMRRVESEAARMTELVDDLLLLARIDSGRPLATGPVDLSRLVIDAVSDARVAGPDHHWRLELPPESVSAV